MLIIPLNSGFAAQTGSVLGKLKPKVFIDRHWRLLALAIVLLCWICHPAANASGQEEVVQIRLNHRHVAEILPMAEPLVSSRGYISADQRTNSLIVIDNPAAIANIRRLVQELDQEVPLLKIRVRYTNVDSDHAREADANVQAQTGDTRVEIGQDRSDESGVEADFQESRGRVRRQSEYMIRVRSGSIAFIESGYDVPDRNRWKELSRRYGYIPDSVVFQRVASGYNVRPVLMGDQVRIEIIPRINYFDNRGRDQKILFAQAATTLFAPLDTWVDIGGLLGGHREVNRQILSDSRLVSDGSLIMRLIVTID